MSSGNGENPFYKALSCPPTERSDKEVSIIYNYLRRLEVFERLHDAPLKSVCRTARLERRPANYVLYKKGQVATCWYVLISGSVIMDRDIYLPIGCFGKRSNMNLRRDTDCIVMQPSDMIVIDYPDVQRITVHHNNFSPNSVVSTNGSLRGSNHSSFLYQNSPQQQAIELKMSSINFNNSFNCAVSTMSNYNDACSSGNITSMSCCSSNVNTPLSTLQNKMSTHVPSPSWLKTSESARICGTADNFDIRKSSNQVLMNTTANQRYRHVRSGSASAEPSTQRFPHHLASNADSSVTQEYSNVFSDNKGVSPFSVSVSSDSNTRRSFHMDELQHLETLRLVKRAHQKVGEQKLSLTGPPPPVRHNQLIRYGRCWSPARVSSTQPPPPMSTNFRRSYNTGEQNKKHIYRHQITVPINQDNTKNYANITFDSHSEAKPLTDNPANEPLLSHPVEHPQPPLRLQRKQSDSASVGSDSISNSNYSGATMVKVRSHCSGPSTSYGTVSRFLRGRSIASSTGTIDGDDFSGVSETVLDSDEDGDDDDEDDEESCPSHDSFQELRDNVRECLEKEPSERCADDISTLMEFMQQMPALASLPLSIKRQLCLKMVFAIVPNAGTVIMQHGEKIDAWSVVVNGAVEHIKKSNGERIEYRLGDCFGTEPSPNVQYQDGEMRTLMDDCEFVLVEHFDYCSIMCTLSQHIEREEDDEGEILREAERKVIGNQVELLITKALPERLIQQLVEDSDAHGCGAGGDAHFLEDFLLMYRVFIFEPVKIVNQLLDWMHADLDGHEPGKYREKVARIFLLWVNNHFSDFESDVEMRRLLDTFESLLECAGMHNQQSLLNIACSVKSKPRVVTLTRSNRAQELSFNILGGKSKLSNSNISPTDSEQFGIFISNVEAHSTAEKNGLKRGDEILEMNGQSFRNINLERALELLKESTHLSLTIKSNLMGFKEMLLRQANETSVSSEQADVSTLTRSTFCKNSQNTINRSQKRSCVGIPHADLLSASSTTATTSASSLNSVLSGGMDRHQIYPTNQHANFNASNGYLTSGSATVSSHSSGKPSMFEKLVTLLKGSTNVPSENGNAQEFDCADESVSPNSLRTSRSNPDISSHIHHIPAGSAAAVAANRHSSFSTGSGGNYQTEQAIKVYRSDQSFRYLLIYPETTAGMIVKAALQEFGMIEASALNNGNISDWALCECTVTREGVMKQRRLPERMQNLAERIGLSSRFYLKNNNRSENLIPDDLALEVLKESRLNMYTLSAQFLAVQLTVQDFAIFSSIEPTEYVNSLFKLDDVRRHCDWPHLRTFEAQFNREMWWVVTEICCERNVYRRSKLIKKFIKIARFCRDLRNFNSMFAIISGLEKPAVRRLAHSWERVSGKYMKMFNDIQQLMDPSRNMSKYRHQLQLAELNPPAIPIYPILRKDLIFAHEGNSTFSGKLVNFDKLRMIARLIRSFVRHSSVQYDVELVMNQISNNTGITSIRKFGANAAAAGSQMPASVGVGQSSRKKLYERMLMIRKVKAYLAEMPFLDSEMELDRRSMECEPPPPGMAGHD